MICWLTNRKRNLTLCLKKPSLIKKPLNWIPAEGKFFSAILSSNCNLFYYCGINRYRREEDSDEELIFDSDDDYESDVPQDTLGKLLISRNTF